MRRTLAQAAAFLAVCCVVEAARAEPAACPRFEASSEGLPKEREWRTHPAFGDVDGDGHLDIAGNPRKGRGPGVWLGDGTGRWTEASTGLVVPGFSCGIGVAFADVDGDGDLELGVADHCAGIHVFGHRGKGRWQLETSPPLHRVRGGYDDLQFGDLNGDGRPEIVATGAMRGGFAVLTRDEKGRWKRQETGLPRRGYAPDVKLADIDGDGDLDVVAAFTSAEPGPRRALPKLPVVWLNEGNWKFRSVVEGLPQEGDFRGVALGDVDGDGRLDLLISAGNWPGRAPLLLYLQPSGFEGGQGWIPAATGHLPVSEGDVFEGVELADLNGDSLLDVVAVQHMKAGLRLWRGLPGGRFEACHDTGLPLGREDERGWGLAVADVNHDQRPDLAYAHGRNRLGAIEVFLGTRAQ